ncbi:MAG: hypothetical protein ACXWC1_33335, partial [Burkholderiales bacterium]
HKYPRDTGTIGKPPEMRIERVAADKVPRCQMRHRVESRFAQSAAGFLDATVVVIRQTGHMHVDPTGKIPL